MKNILLTTDLSEKARASAFEAALAARDTGARLILLCGFELAPAETHAAEPEYQKDKLPPLPAAERGMQERLDALAAELHQLYGISVTRLLQPGLTPQKLLDLTRQLQAALYTTSSTAGQALPLTQP